MKRREKKSPNKYKEKSTFIVFKRRIARGEKRRKEN